MLKKRRIETLERLAADATARWIHSLSDEELCAVASSISPAEEAFLASLTTEQLRHLSTGHMCLGEYRELRRAWEVSTRGSVRLE